MMAPLLSGIRIPLNSNLFLLSSTFASGGACSLEQH